MGNQSTKDAGARHSCETLGEIMVCKAHMIPDKVTEKNQNKNLTTACVCKCKNMLETQIQKILCMARGKAYLQNKVVTARDDQLLYDQIRRP